MGAPVLLATLVAASSEVGTLSGRTAKRDVLAALLHQTDPAEAPIAVGFLLGEPRQGRIGVGWATLAAAEVSPPAAEPSLTLSEVDAVLDELAALGGAGSGATRRRALGALLARATAAEGRFLVALLGGEVRHGARHGVLVEAIAAAAGAPAARVRRAAMLSGDLGATAQVALTGGAETLAEIGLAVGTPLSPMLAATAPSVAEAVEALGEVAVDWKLDGIRIQVHRHDDEVLVVSRNLNDITARVADVVEVARSLPARSLILDGEALVEAIDGRPLPFQDTASRVSADGRAERVRPWFFDLLHLDGRDLIDEPLAVRRRLLEEVAGPWAVPSVRTTSAGEATAAAEAALSAGHEGVVVKDVRSTYDAGRRGKAWRKVKPVHTLDLVILAAEWGHGRRTGWLSNLHLGARSDGGDGFVMVGKTFKGLTDEMLRGQTEALLARATDPVGVRHQGSVVWVRPELVVEIAVDGIQRSTRYPGGIALRFARVLRHRPDKVAAEADTLATVRALAPEP